MDGPSDAKSCLQIVWFKSVGKKNSKSITGDEMKRKFGLVARKIPHFFFLQNPEGGIDA